MKSFFYVSLILFLMLGTVPAFAQIGIGTKTPAPSAALEVTSSTNNKGILIPRLSATQKDAIVSPAEGLMIFQTTAPAGFYYYSSGAWKLIIGQTDLASGNAGSATKLATVRTINGVAFDGTANITVTADAGTLTGNLAATKITGTLPVSNGGTGAETAAAARTNLGLGNVDNTTDAAKPISTLTQAALDLKANTETANFTKDITVNGVNIGRGNGVNGSNTRIGGQALTSNTSGYENVAIGDASLSKNTTGGRNNAIGTSALFKNTTGSENTAIGTYALENNINGNRNLAIGQQTLFTNTEGIKNVALGYVPLYSNTTGSNNNAIGDETLFYNTTGNYNTGIGSRAGLTISTGSQNTMIGAQADVASGAGALTNATALGFGAKVSASNTIQLGNTDVTNIKTSGTITVGAVTYPRVDGTAGQVLTANGSGVPTWINLPNNVTYTIGVNNELGGYVFYLAPGGKHGLVAAMRDQRDNVSYGDFQDAVNNPNYHDAAGGKFTDWRIPSIYELSLMVSEKTSLNLNTSGVGYASSTFYDYRYFKVYNFMTNDSNGRITAFPFSSGNYYLRAVRSF